MRSSSVELKDHYLRLTRKRRNIIMDLGIDQQEHQHVYSPLPHNKDIQMHIRPTFAF